MLTTQPYKIILLLSILAFGCTTTKIKRELYEVQEVTKISPDNKFIKAHMKNGTVYILHDWYFQADTNQLVGYGTYMDVRRKVQEERKNEKSESNSSQAFLINLDEVSLIETNDTGPSVAGGLAVVTGITGAFTIFCIINPKACFGSCPTFYAFDGDTLSVQAEGFSTSVLPSLEKKDIDMLYSAVGETEFQLTVTNEALETHSIRYANLLAFEKKRNERVFVDVSGSFYRVKDISVPTSFNGAQDDELQKVQKADQLDWFSLTDPDDLNTREEIYLSFNPASNEKPGLIIGKRQTLLTTYLMYQGLAYMGNAASYWLSEYERGNNQKESGVFGELGGIEVYQKNLDGEWAYVGEVNETGPIATDYHILPMADLGTDEIEIKLRLTKGLWRINYLALGSIVEEVEPLVIHPSSVQTIIGLAADPLEKLTDEEEFLVTYPGDKYEIKYELPIQNAALFLESKGYYLEWIREEWVKEQDMKKLSLMLNNPKKYLKKSAADFKKLEPSMEEAFWNSRYVKQ